MLITRAEHTLVKRMLLAEDRLPDHDDLITIRNLPSVLGWITSLTEHTASEDLGYTILHHINSLANDLIGPTLHWLPLLVLPFSHYHLGLSSPHPGYKTSPLRPPIWIHMMPYWSPWSTLLVSIEMSICRPLLGPLAPIIMPPILC